MGLMVSVYGGNAGDDTYSIPKQYNMSCPNVCKDGRPNFWQHRCLERIGNKNISSCFKGCKEAAKYPETKIKMDKVIANIIKNKASVDAKDRQQAKEFNRERYKQGIINLRLKPKLTKKDRTKIVNMYLTSYSVKETCKEVDCGRSAVSLYRKMYRDGAMDEYGTIMND